MDDENVILVLRHPILVVRQQDVSIRRTIVIDRHAGAAGQVQGVRRHCFHGIDHSHIFKGNIGAFGNTDHLIHVLLVAFLGKWDVFACLDLGAFPGQFQLDIRIGNQFTAVLNAMLNLFAAGFADLASHLAVRP